MTDYLTLPEITGVFTASYKDIEGDQFNIKAKVSYKIIEMEVTITGSDGTVLETGIAQHNRLKWKYIATVANAQVKGSKLTLVARDRQDKESTFEQLL